MKKVMLALMLVAVVTVSLWVNWLFTRHGESGVMDRGFNARTDIPTEWFDIAARYHGDYYFRYDDDLNLWVFNRGDVVCVVFTIPVAHWIVRELDITEEQRSYLNKLVGGLL